MDHSSFSARAEHDRKKPQDRGAVCLGVGWARICSPRPCLAIQIATRSGEALCDDAMAMAVAKKEDSIRGLVFARGVRTEIRHSLGCPGW